MLANKDNSCSSLYGTTYSAYESYHKWLSLLGDFVTTNFRTRAPRVRAPPGAKFWRCDWLYNNCAAEDFLTRNFVANFIRLKLNLLKKNNRFWATFWGLRGNVRTPSIARWKARGRLPIRHNWAFFRYLLWLIRYKWTSVEVNVFLKGWVNLSAHFRRKESSPTNHCWCQRTSVIALCVVSTYPPCIGWFCHKAHAQHSETDRQTDRWTELRLPRRREHSCVAR